MLTQESPSLNIDINNQLNLNWLQQKLYLSIPKKEIASFQSHDIDDIDGICLILFCYIILCSF